MRILIPGISGRLGQMLAERLVGAGHEVFGIDRRPWPDAPLGVEMFNTDIRKRPAEEVFRKTRPQAVVHMATVSHFVAEREERYRINLGGTRAVFEHCEHYGVEQAIFVGRHTYYGASAESPLYHVEDEPPMALETYPELSDLVAADLYAQTALWRIPKLATAVLRMCYTLGPTGHGTLATFLRPARIPSVLGFDPLFQFMHERDVVSAIELTLQRRLHGVFNVAGPPPLPLSMVIRLAGRTNVPIPAFVYTAMLGRFGFPSLPPGAVSHIQYPVVIDSRAFREATGFRYAVSESDAIREFREAFPRPVRKRSDR